MLCEMILPHTRTPVQTLRRAHKCYLKLVALANKRPAGLQRRTGSRRVDARSLWSTLTPRSTWHGAAHVACEARTHKHGCDYT